MMTEPHLATSFTALLQAMTLTDMDIVRVEGVEFIEWQAEEMGFGGEVKSRSFSQVLASDYPELAGFIEVWRDEVNTSAPTHAPVTTEEVDQKGGEDEI